MKRKFLFAQLLAWTALSCVTGNMPAVAAAPAPTAAQIMAVCDAQTIDEANSKGDALGWPRMTDAQIDPWRKSFLAYNKGSVLVAGWKKSEKPDDDILSFWMAVGRDSHRACSYLMSSPATFLDDLIALLGTPQTLEKDAGGTRAFWKHGNREVQYSQSGQTVAMFNVSYQL